MKQVLDILLTPEVFGGLVALVVALLIKSKVITEAQYKTAKTMIDGGNRASDITDKTRLTIQEVAHELATASGPGDSNRKKIQRGARKLLRGWLKF